MAHEIQKNTITGKDEIAYTGERPWHGLGQELDKNASIPEWIEAAQMNWEVHGAPVEYCVNDEVYTFDDKQLLYRSDDRRPLGIVSNGFKVVQPLEILEFFSDLVQIHGMQLSSAGCLFGGKRFWATAETGNFAEILPGDKVKGYLLLMTGVDGTLATTGKFTTTRVVCNNTLTLALREGGDSVKTTHRQTWNPKQVKIDLGLINETWDNYIHDMTKLTQVEMDDKASRTFFTELMKKPQEDINELSRATENAVEELMYRMKNGLGVEYGQGSAWNVLNAVTEKFTHGSSRRNSDNQFINSYYGTDAKIKRTAVDKLLEMV